MEKNVGRWIACVVASLSMAMATAQSPLYIVNGVERDSIADIPQSDIAHIEQLPANEQTVATYGEKANDGVILISLRYDTPARFNGGENYAEYIANHVKWQSYFAVARVVFRCTICTDGTCRVASEIESTDRRFRKKVISAMKSAPRWTPATKGGVAIESEYVLRIQLPRGKELPREPYIVML